MTCTGNIPLMHMRTVRGETKTNNTHCECCFCSLVFFLLTLFKLFLYFNIKNKSLWSIADPLLLFFFVVKASWSVELILVLCIAACLHQKAWQTHSEIQSCFFNVCCFCIFLVMRERSSKKLIKKSQYKSKNGVL